MLGRFRGKQGADSQAGTQERETGLSNPRTKASVAKESGRCRVLYMTLSQVRPVLLAESPTLKEIPPGMIAQHSSLCSSAETKSRNFVDDVDSSPFEIHH
ncbi:hypothetical protein ABVK25_009845 [Lepraria finkii]|uniref:Uncharacterized protein n=1 Tax=Lepraria finkii TaxID=1340010 RepID=A0ABR4AYT1_9LECA